MAACAGVGGVLFDDWVEWVLRGHHGHKEENIRPFKWKGLGKYAGHTKLYSLAKKQDPNWTKRFLRSCVLVLLVELLVTQRLIRWSALMKSYLVIKERLWSLNRSRYLMPTGQA